MARDKKTLSDLFAPPSGGMQGIHALLCAYSADEAFLRQALDRFTGVGPQSRLARGSVDATLVLEPSHQVFEAQVVPGLCQLYPKPREARPWLFDQMHAKVALLAFGKCRIGEPAHYRIVVSTGNWTELSARRLIEMAWYIDIPADSKEVTDLRDLHACATFFDGLLGCYLAEPAIAEKALVLMRRCRARGMAAGPRTITRFSSNMPVRESDGPQSLLRRFTAAAMEEGTARNILVCGSGFYEKDTGTDAAPKVIGMLSDALRKNKLLTDSPEMDVVLNPECGGQVARHYREADTPALFFYRPKDPVGGEHAMRTQLHAKFCYIGKIREGGLSSGLLYVGSGNLTFPGFIRRPQSVANAVNKQEKPGNVETGVIIHTNAEEDSGYIDTWAKLQRRLPIGSLLKPDEVQVQDKPDDAQEELLPSNKPLPPVTAFTFGPSNALTVHWAMEALVAGPVEVDIPGQGLVIIPEGAGQILLDAAPAVQWLTVRANSVEWRIPCLGANGEYPRCATRQATFGNWLDEIADFPGSWNDPAADDPDTEGDDEGNVGGRGVAALPGGDAGFAVDRNFPAHAAALLVESIAQQNGDVSEDYMEDYLAHLRRALIDGPPGGFLEEWRALKVNFLAPLLSKEGFAPEWKDLGPYKQLVKDVMNAWGFDQLPSLGELP